MRRNKIDWDHHFENFQRSGITQAEYCRLHKIPKGSFSARKSLLKKGGKLYEKKKRSSSFIKVEKAPTTFTISINGNIELTFPELPSCKWMAEFIRELGNAQIDFNSY